jgi:hypothetical protein
LNSSRVNRSTHQAAKRIDLANEMTFRRPPDRWIAGHVGDGITRRDTDSDPQTESCARDRRLNARVSGADYDDVEVRHLTLRRKIILFMILY